jgi:hypothetical protein
MSCKSSNRKELSVLKNEGIWRYYLRVTNGQFAKCKLCDNIIIENYRRKYQGLHAHMHFFNAALLR